MRAGDVGAADKTSIDALSVRDCLRFFFRVVAPTWSKGILLRRRVGMALAARLDLDRKAVACVQSFRRRYGEGPLLLRTPRRPQYLILAADDMAHVLDSAPEPFTPATKEKRTALSHFEPHGSLATPGSKRPVRRQFSDDVLQSSRVVHRGADYFAAIVRDEAANLLGLARGRGELNWPMFTEAWYRAARRIVLGDLAADDRALTKQLARLRAGANWALFPQRQATRRKRFHARLASYLTRAESGSLAAIIAARPPHEGEEPLDQVTQWLFAFDGGGMAAFRALALLTSHPNAARQAAVDVGAWSRGEIDLPYLRAAFLDAVRLWPTTPVILRESTAVMPFAGAMLPRGAGLIVYVPYFHRDDERLTDADRFAPEFWIGRDPAAAWPFVPFSAGPAACPGRHLTSLIASVWLGALLADVRWVPLRPNNLGQDRPLPATFDHFAIRLGAGPRCEPIPDS